MRSIETIILRIQADLPVTKEEADAASEFLDKRIAAQRRFLLSVFVMLVVSFMAMYILISLGIIK